MHNRKTHRFGLLISALLVGLLVLAACGAAAAEAHSGEWGELHWDLSEAGVLTVSGNGPLDSFPFNDAERADKAWQPYKDEILHVIVEEGITDIGECSFYSYSNVLTMSFPSSMTKLDITCYINCPSLTAINVGAGCAEYCSEDGVLYNKKKTLLKLYPSAKAGESYTVPAGVKKLEDNSIKFNKYLKKVVLPDSLDYIGCYAFQHAESLESINLPEGLTWIDWDAFENCLKLKEITIPHSLTKLSAGVFYNCPALEKVTILGGVKNLESYMFAKCSNLTTVVLPKSVIGIWNYAFSGCEKLKTVKYAGSKEDRENIGIGPNNEPLENAKWIYGTSGTTYDFTKAKIEKISDCEYTGKAIHPSPRVTYEGTRLKRDTDYTVTYQNCKQVGLATVTVTGIGKYDGVKELTFRILPAGVKITDLKAGKKQLTVQWKKNSSVTGYEVEYGTKKDFSDALKVRIKDADQKKAELTGLKAKKKYYVRIRTYQKVDGKYYYSAWSDVKEKKTK